MNIKKKHIAILGAVRSGLGAAKLAKRLGAIPFVSDLSPKEKIVEQISELEDHNIAYESDSHSERVFDADFIVTSPGVPSDAEVLIEAERRNIDVYSEIEFASWFCKSKIIGITGTNGKTTTASLLAFSLKEAGYKCYLAGNIGYAFSECVLKADENDYVVLELSSFQLDHINSFKPDYAVILNITPDHLNRYKNDFELYKKSKLRIFENQNEDDFLILNKDDKILNELKLGKNVKPIWFSTRERESVNAFINEENFHWNYKENSECIIKIEDFSLNGEHNISNALSVLSVLKLENIDNKKIKDAFMNFEAVEHRLELVAEKNGVSYINDSKATNVDSVWYALGSFGEKPIHLILGGKDKGNDYELIKDLVRKNVKKIYAIGSSSKKVYDYFNGIVEVQITEKLENTIEFVSKEVVKGEVVLFSPACASFDQFKNYEHRGEVFKELVRKLNE